MTSLTLNLHDPLTSKSIENTNTSLPNLITQLQKNELISAEATASHSIQKIIQNIDKLLSKQLSAVLHHPQFNTLEASWRGIEHVSKQSPQISEIQLKCMHATKGELLKDFEKAPAFDQSHLFKHIYDNEFGSPGGKPFAALVADYQFSHSHQDVCLLEKLSMVGATAFCPILSAADSKLLQIDTWEQLDQPQELKSLFATDEYIGWRRLRQQESTRFLNLTLPRVMARLPFDPEKLPCESFFFSENIQSENDYCWMNAAYVLATRVTQAFAKSGWALSIRGAESGGKIDCLPLHSQWKNGQWHIQCPTETCITDRREAELSELGLLPLSFYKNTDYAVFFGGQSLQEPNKYDRANATANASLSARLPYILAVSRFAHYLKIMARDKIGSAMEAEDLEAWLNRWILNYVNANATASPALRAKYPLAEARVKVEAIDDQPGHYRAVAWLRPWLQLEGITSSMRLVANIPKLQS